MSPGGHQALRACVHSSSRPWPRWGLTLLVVMATVLLGALPRTASAVDFKYHSQLQVSKLFRKLMKQYPAITKVITLGKTNDDNDLLVMSIGKHAKKAGLLIPNVKYIANMHGNEVVGREMLLHLAEHFLVGYGSNETIKEFLDNTTVHLMPTMNPDGFATSMVGDCVSVKGRGNYNYKDLNRNFPDPHKNRQDAMEIETQMVDKWTKKVPFVLSANLHGGAEVVNYPWDSLNGDMARVQYAASPDDDVFRHLSLTYSRSHPTMHQGASCGDSFQDGITNGANWYPVMGGMQDHMYRNGRGYELLIEMSCCKYPDPYTLPDFWKKNKDALINLLFAVHIGVKGFVLFNDGTGISKPLDQANVSIVGREEIVTQTSKSGEFFRLLLPGQYSLKVSKEGYKPMIVEFMVYGHGNVTTLTIELHPIITPVPSPTISNVDVDGNEEHSTSTEPSTSTSTHQPQHVAKDSNLSITIQRPTATFNKTITETPNLEGHPTKPVFFEEDHKGGGGVPETIPRVPLLHTPGIVAESVDPSTGNSSVSTTASTGKMKPSQTSQPEKMETSSRDKQQGSSSTTIESNDMTEAVSENGYKDDAITMSGEGGRGGGMGVKGGNFSSANDSAVTNELDRYFSSSATGGASTSGGLVTISTKSYNDNKDFCRVVFQTVARLLYTFLLVVSSSILSC